MLGGMGPGSSNLEERKELPCHATVGLPWWLRGRVRLQDGKPRFESWIKKIPWRRKWQPTPVLLPGKSHGRRSLVGYNSWVTKSQT